MKKPNIFIASSNEALNFAEAVHIRLESVGKIDLWDNVFSLSSITITTLIETAHQCDYAVFVFHGDDITQIMEQEYNAVRDNVLFELGLFIGVLGLQRCFILIPKSIRGRFRLPTDLSGVTVTFYDQDSDEQSAVTSSCAEIKRAIKKIESGKTDEKDSREEQLRQYESQIWRMKHDLEDCTRKLDSIYSLVMYELNSKLKPATRKEIQDWEQGFEDHWEASIKIQNHQIFVVDSDVILPPLYGASSISLIVKEGVKVKYTELGHNTLYFIEGYRHTS